MKNEQAKSTVAAGAEAMEVDEAASVEPCGKKSNALKGGLAGLLFGKKDDGGYDSDKSEQMRLVEGSSDSKNDEDQEEVKLDEI